MNKVGIITFHFVNNFGAVLQCVALNEYIMKQEVESVVINYRPQYQTYKYAAFRNPFLSCRFYKTALNANKVNGTALVSRMCYHFIKALLLNRYYFRRHTKNKRFMEFINDAIEQTQVYQTLNQLKENPPACDLYICGSDQIWSTIHTNNDFDAAYFLNFGERNVVRAAYAVSMGETDINAYGSQMRELIKPLDLLSLRERESCQKMMTLTKRPVSYVIDPTLLLATEDYSKFEKPASIKNDYILVYFLQKSHGLDEIVERIAKDLKLPLYDVSPQKYFNCDAKIIRKHSLGPGEFLTCIRNATFVITNSFHGTAFSMIYHKEFVTIPHTKSAIRMIDLCNTMGIPERIICSASDYKSISSKIDYEQVDIAMAQLRESSKNYLHTALELIDTDKEQAKSKDGLV